MPPDFFAKTRNPNINLTEVMVTESAVPLMDPKGEITNGMGSGGGGIQPNLIT